MPLKDKPLTGGLTNEYDASDPRLFEFRNEQFAANFYGAGVRTMQKMRRLGIGPRFFKIGRLVRYRLIDLIEYATNQAKGDGSEK